MRRLFCGIFFAMIFCGYALACVTDDADYLFKVQAVKIDKSKLEAICKDKVCISNSAGNWGVEFYLRAYSDHDVGIIIEVPKGEKKLTPRLTLVLPYKLLKSGDSNSGYRFQVVPDRIDPKTYDWLKTVKKELVHLRVLGILDISDPDIEVISQHAKGGVALGNCFGKWLISPEGVGCDLICSTGESYGVMHGDVEDFGMNWSDFVAKMKEKSWGQEKVIGKVEDNNTRVFLNIDKIWPERDNLEQAFGKKLAEKLRQAIESSEWVCPNGCGGTVNFSETFPPDAL